MKSKISKPIYALRKIANLFDEKSNADKLILLKQISKLKFEKAKSFLVYFDLLQFICAYPPNKKVLTLAEKELTRLTKFCQNSIKKDDSFFENSELPFSTIVMGFSHDCLRWLLNHPHCKIEFDSYENPKFDLNDALRLTLPSLEADETSVGWDSDELLEALSINKKETIPFLLQQFDKFNDSPFLKDFLFEGLDVYIKIKPTNKLFSKAYNRCLHNDVFFHSEILKRFDDRALLNLQLPESKKMSSLELATTIRVVKNSMALTLRETDPITYMDENSFRLYELERGISIAIYGMVPNRQLPLESYVGYTLFKNGFQAAYGGGWVFGERSLFGINISESLRGGESGFILCQLLRVYRQVFGINYFEVEPYQYGADNPDGIKSGAFWFYYRYGFRPLDKKLAVIAANEMCKIKSKKGYRTRFNTLEKFTESNIALNLSEQVSVKVADLTMKVRKMISGKFNGNRNLAEKEAIKACEVYFGNIDSMNKPQKQVFKEVSMLALAMDVRNNEKLALMKEMILTKPVDLYAYQNLLLQFLKN